MNLTHKRFFGGLESLRGVAALMVVLYHITWANPLTMRLFVRNAYMMVDLFFVLSGFVICHNYAPKIKKAKDVVQFMFLRFGRLYPLHLFFLLAFLGIECIKYVGERKFGFVASQSRSFTVNNPHSFIANLLLIHPFFPSTNKTFNSPSWSIGVEFYTYLVFALVVLLAPGKKGLSIVSGFLVLLAVFSLIVFGGGGLTVMNGWSFLRCIIGFFWGVLGYQIYDRHHAHISRWGAKLELGLVVLLVAFLSLKENPQWDYAVLLIYAPLVIVIASCSGEGGVISKALNSAPMRWLGKVSYSIYMAHLFIVMFMTRLLAFVEKKLGVDDRTSMMNSGFGLAFVFLTIIVVLIVSRFTHQWIEVAGQKKFRNLAAKWFGREAGDRPAKLTV